MGQPDLAYASPSSVAVAREPILDLRQRAYGYALSFAPSWTAAEPAARRGRAIADTIARIGLDAIAGGRRAFIRVDRSLLLDGLPLLPSPDIILEIEAGIEVDDDVLRACRELRDAGYSLALDDFDVDAWTAPLVPFVDYLKVDCRRGLDSEARARSIACLKPGVKAVIATHVEAFDQFEAAAHDGFTAFQGFFFGRPLVVPGRDVAGHHLAALRLLRALNDPNLSIGQLEDLVSHDAALCYRILRTVNSAGFGLRRTVQSMHDALLLLGRDAVRRWASLWALAGLGENRPSEIVVMATVRARCCELIAASARGEAAAGDAFLLGMCSLLDVLLDRPMNVIVAELPLEDETRRALCGEANGKRQLLDCTIAYERGDWAACTSLATAAGINPAIFAAASAEALRWAHELSCAAPIPGRSH
jgi:c-di-GMP-related signal transduction protein